VAVAHEAARDVGAHAAEPYDADVHASFPPGRRACTNTQ
jgi:hypothetical protein